MLRSLAIGVCLLLGLGANAVGATETSGQTSLTYQFDLNGVPAIHTYKLIWPSADAPLKTIEVLNSETMEPLQTLQVPGEKVSLTYNQATSGGEQIVDATDYNFDRYADFRVATRWPYKAGEKSYLVYLFRPDENAYALHDELSGLSAPVIDRGRERIVSVELQGKGGGEYTRREYVLEGSQLRLMTRIKQTLVDDSRMRFQRDVYTRVDGELQPVCRLRVPGPGRPERLWGTETWCDRFKTKRAWQKDEDDETENTEEEDPGNEEDDEPSGESPEPEEETAPEDEPTYAEPIAH